MDHRWDRGAREGAAARREQERYGAPRIEHDPDVERRDRLVAMRPQQSPWEIGLAHYDQRDLYTRDSRIDAAGYGRGPNWHPEEGSYAYAREPRRPVPQPRTDATIFEREAWPWLNYHDVEEDPFQRDLHKRDSGFWDRLKGTFSPARGPKNAQRSDDRIREDVLDILTFRGDIDATDIEVTVSEAEVTLTGTVPDRHTKKLAEETAAGVRGVRDVHNRLEIRKDDPTDANVAFVLPLALLGGS